jgi:hypothetical protein
LFEKALALLEASRIPVEEWSFGGGTALALFLGHRESADVDIFLTDAQYLTFLTPRLNRVAASMTADYVEAAGFLKLKLPGGEVDFIIAPYLTPNPRLMTDVVGKRVYVETPEEIVLKKLFYRTETFKIRDVVDAAAVFAERREELLRQAGLLCSKLDILRRRWEKLQGVYAEEVRGLRILKEDLVKDTPVLFIAFLEELMRRCKTSARKSGAGEGFKSES